MKSKERRLMPGIVSRVEPNSHFKTDVINNLREYMLLFKKKFKLLKYKEGDNNDVS